MTPPPPAFSVSIIADSRYQRASNTAFSCQLRRHISAMPLTYEPFSWRWRFSLFRARGSGREAPRQNDTLAFAPTTPRESPVLPPRAGALSSMLPMPLLAVAAEVYGLPAESSCRHGEPDAPNSCPGRRDYAPRQRDMMPPRLRHGDIAWLMAQPIRSSPPPPSSIFPSFFAMTPAQRSRCRRHRRGFAANRR